MFSPSCNSLSAPYARYAWNEIMARVIAVSASPGPSAVCSFAPCAAALPLSHISAFPHLVRGEEEGRERRRTTRTSIWIQSGVWSIVRDAAVADPEGFVWFRERIETYFEVAWIPHFKRICQIGWQLLIRAHVLFYSNKNEILLHSFENQIENLRNLCTFICLGRRYM